MLQDQAFPLFPLAFNFLSLLPERKIGSDGGAAKSFVAPFLCPPSPIVTPFLFVHARMPCPPPPTTLPLSSVLARKTQRILINVNGGNVLHATHLVFYDWGKRTEEEEEGEEELENRGT